MLQSSGWRCRGYGDMYRCVDNRCVQAPTGFPTNVSCQIGCGPMLPCQAALHTLCGAARKTIVHIEGAPRRGSREVAKQDV